jgi:hypothetical protein
MGTDPSSPSSEDAALAARLGGLSLPTVAQRRGGGAPEVPAMTFDPAPHGPNSQRTVSRIETAGGVIVVHERDRTFEVPLTAEWTVGGSPLAASAARLAGGRLAVDLVFLATPHRLEIELDPSTSTFVTRWPLVPLFGAGLANRLVSMLTPVD